MEFLKELQEKQKALLERLDVPVAGFDDRFRKSNMARYWKNVIEKWNKEYILAMHAELSELLEWANWKHWKTEKVEYTDERINEIHIELIDILHFWMNLCIVWSLTPERIIELYREKNIENHKRQDKGY
mgnify:FL=1